MEKVKKMRLVGILLVIAALVAMMIPVTATADQTGTIIIHKYMMEDATTATTLPHDGSELDADQLQALADAGATPLDGIKFDVYTISADDITAKGQPAVGVTYTVTGTALSDGTNTYGLTSAGTITSGTDGTGSSDALPYGLYVVVEQPDARVDSASDPFIVSLPMADSDGNPLDTVNVYPKNEKLTITKKASKYAVQVGDPVTFTLTAKVPSDAASAKSYAITDKLDAALDLNSVTVVGGSLSETGDFDIALIAGTDYNITPSPATGTGADVKVTFTPAGLAKLAAAHALYVKVELATTVNKTILGYPTNTVDNTADILFENKFWTGSEPKDIPSNKETIHDASIKVIKEDASGNPLTGAEFALASSLDNAKAGIYLRKDSATGMLYDSPTAKWSDLTSADDYKVEASTGTDSNVALFNGLLDGATYYLVETKAPAGGYNLAAPIEVIINGTAGNNYTVTQTVKDNKGYTLPLTGAAGVAIFTIVGIVLLGMAVILVVNLTKKKAIDSQAI